MLTQLAPNLWSATHHLSVSGLPLTSRMTVVRLSDGGLWLHSPVPIDAALYPPTRSYWVRRVCAPNDPN